MADTKTPWGSISEPYRSKDVAFQVWTIAPKQSTPYERNTKRGSVVFVVSGHGSIQTSDDQLSPRERYGIAPMPAGAHYYFPVNYAVKITNDGDSKLVLAVMQMGEDHEGAVEVL